MRPILASIPFPALDPVLFRAGPPAVRWYGVAYLAGFAVAYIILRKLIRRGTLRMTPAALVDLIGWLTVRYPNGLTINRPLQIFVNGSLVGTVASAATGAWTTWKTATLDVANLPAGTVTVKAVVSTGAGGPNLDSLTTA